MLLLMVFGAMLFLMLMRVRMLVASAKTEGQHLKDFRLTFRERLLMQRVNMYEIGRAHV